MTPCTWLWFCLVQFMTYIQTMGANLKAIGANTESTTITYSALVIMSFTNPNYTDITPCGPVLCGPVVGWSRPFIQWRTVILNGYAPNSANVSEELHHMKVLHSIGPPYGCPPEVVCHISINVLNREEKLHRFCMVIPSCYR